MRGKCLGKRVVNCSDFGLVLWRKRTRNHVPITLAQFPRNRYNLGEESSNGSQDSGYSNLSD